MTRFRAVCTIDIFFTQVNFFCLPLRYPKFGGNLHITTISGVNFCTNKSTNSSKLIEELISTFLFKIELELVPSCII